MNDFRAARLLMACSELGIVEALAAASASLDVLAERTGLSRRITRICADATVAIGLWERADDAYRDRQAAAGYLAGTATTQITSLDPELQRIFSEGVEAVNLMPAAALAGTGDNQRLLANVRRAVEPGARLLLVDYWTDRRTPSRSSPVPSGVRVLTLAERRRYVWRCGMGGLPA